jgi:hypothetical protein
VTSVAVVNDDTGRITIQINLANRPAPKHFVMIGVDADRNASTGTTGSPRGVDYLIMTDSNNYEVTRAAATGWEPTDISAVYQPGNRGLRLTIASSDLDVGRSFRFAVRTMGGKDKNVWDDAPDSGRLVTYTLGPPSQLSTMQRVTIPLPNLMPKAGALLKAGAKVTVIPGGQSGSVQYGDVPDKVRCSAKIGSTVVPTAGRSCVFRVPQGTRGKELVLTITVAYRGDEWTGVYPVKVE